MAGALGDLVIALHADTAKFTSDMGRAARVSEQNWERMASAAKVAGAAIAAAALAAGAAAIKMGHDFIEAAANLDDMAEKTGASVEELSRFEQQARISGIALDTVEMALVRLSKSANLSDEESKKATKALEALGLKAEELRGMDTATALRTVAVAMNQFGDGSGKTALALDLFGKSGAAVLPFLKDLANDLQVGANVTAKQAAEAEELGKAWRRLQNEGQNVWRTMALDMVPGLIKLIEQMKEAKEAAGGLASGLLLLIKTKSRDAFFGLDLKGTREQIERLEERRSTQAGRGLDTSSVDKALAEARKSYQILQLQQRQAALSIPGGDTPGETRRLFTKPTLDYTSPEKAEKAKKAAKEAADDSEKLMREQIAQSGRLLKADLEAQKYYAGEIKKIADEEEKDREDQIKEQSRLHKMDLDAMKDYAQQVEKMSKATEKTDDFAKSLGLTFSSAFEDAVVNGKKFRDVLQGIAADIAKIILRKQVTEPLANAVGKFDFGGLFKAVFGGGGDTAPAPQRPPDVPSLPVPSFAVGTDYVPRTGLALVHQGEKIIPAGENGGSGFTMNVSIDARGADAGAVQRIETGLVQLERRVVPMVRDASRRTR